MDLVEFTTCEDIRAALGVSEDEIESTTISLPLYLYSLEAELREAGTALIADYRAVLAKDEATRSEAEGWFFRTVGLFATYSVARHLTASLPLFAPREITDSKAGVVRVANPFEQVTQRVAEQFSLSRGRMLSAYAAFSTPGATVTKTGYSWGVRASPTSDPVLGT